MNYKDIKHVVLADDDRDHGMLFERVVHKFFPNVELSFVHNGEELLDHLHTHDVDLVFLDLKMPCMNGYECLAEIRKDSELKNLPVIVYSGSAHLLDIKEAFMNSADVYMVKPFSTKHLVAALKQVFIKNWKDKLFKHYFINNRFVPFTAF